MISLSGKIRYGKSPQGDGDYFCFQDESGVLSEEVTSELRSHRVRENLPDFPNEQGVQKP